MTAEFITDIAVWWPLLPSTVRTEIETNLNREPLSTDAIHALVSTRGYGPAAVGFIEGDPNELSRFFLTHAEYEWIAEQSGQALY